MDVPVEWLVKQGDLFWRHDSQGYARSVLEAGLYTEEHAKRIEACKRIPLDKAIHISEYREEIETALRNAHDKLSTLTRYDERQK